MTVSAEDAKAEDRDDFDSARVLLVGMFDPATAGRLVDQLKGAPVVRRQAQDIIRSACIVPLPPDEPMVAHFIKKFRRGKVPNPVLLVEWRPLVIADGHHRVSAAYHFDPETFVSCKVA